MYTDILLLVIVAFFAIIGAVKGFLSQVLSIATLVAILLFADPISSWAKNSVDWQWAQESPRLVLWALAAFGIFGLGLMTQMIVHRVKKDALMISPIDRWLGFALGAFKGAVVVLVLGLVVHVLPERQRSAFHEWNADWHDSKFAKVSGELMQWEFVWGVRSLKEIRERLDTRSFVASPSTPWDHGSVVDSD